MDRYSPELERVKQQLRQSAHGMTVIELSRALKINRNSMAKYLDVLIISGEVEFDRIGPAKRFFLSQRMPLYEMLSVTSDCILILDMHHMVTFANSAFLEAEGLRPDDIIGEKISSLNLKMVSDEILTGLEKAGPGITLEKELVIDEDSESRIFKVKMIGTVLHGGINGITLFYEDITKKRLCQQKLKSSEQLYRAVVEDQTEFIIRYLPDRTVIFANEAYCRAFGVDREDIIGTNFIPPIPPRDLKRVKAQFADITVQNPIVVTENPVMMPNMTIGWHKWTNRGLFNEQGQLVEYQSVGRDITNQVKGEKAKMELIFEITLLSDFTTGLLSIDTQDRLFELLGTYLRKTGPHSCIIILSFTRTQGVIRYVTQGTHWRNKKWTDYFEEHQKRLFPCSPEVQMALSPKVLVPFPSDVFQYSGMSGTPLRCLANYLPQYEIHCMGIGSEDSCQGSVIYISSSGNPPNPERLIETLLRQTTAILPRIRR